MCSTAIHRDIPYEMNWLLLKFLKKDLLKIVLQLHVPISVFDLTVDMEEIQKLSHTIWCKR